MQMVKLKKINLLNWSKPNTGLNHGFELSSPALIKKDALSIFLSIILNKFLYIMFAETCQ